MSQEEAKKISLELQMERLSHEMEKITTIIPALNKLAEGSKELQEFVSNEITRFAMSIRHSKLDKTELEGFFTHPYFLYKERRDKENDWHLAIPKFVDRQFGWLEKTTPSHNVFLINRYVDWVGELSPELKKLVGMKDPLDVFLDNDALVGKDIQKIVQKYKPFIKKIDKDRLIIDKKRHFELLATLIKDGILPFIPKPIPKEAFRLTQNEIVLRDYQEEGWNMFKKYSNVGIFFPPSGGKTWQGMFTMSNIDPHFEGADFHAVAVPTRLLIEQWEDRIELNTGLEIGKDVIVGTYQNIIKRCAKKKISCLIVDEAHHLPSNQFSKLAVLNRVFTLGLSATPQREDNREEYIFALTGKPVGLSWAKLKELGIISNPDLHVWIVKNEAERIVKLSSLLEEQIKTIIFCDSIELGKTVSKKFDIPHVYGDTKQRLDKIQDSLVSVVSRVGDEGVSLPDIQRVIEIDWLHGSRRQELQRFTRLLHSKKTKGIGHIIMTIQQYQTDHKRLYGVMDKGFKIIIHREDKGTLEKVIEKDRPVITRNAKINTEEIDPWIKSHAILGLPGVLKKIAQLNKAETSFVKLCFQDKDKIYTREQLCALLGFASTNSIRFSINFNKVINLQLVKKAGKGYQADLEFVKK